LTPNKITGYSIDVSASGDLLDIAVIIEMSFLIAMGLQSPAHARRRKVTVDQVNVYRISVL